MSVLENPGGVLEQSTSASSALVVGACLVSRFNRVQLFLTLWTATYWTPLSMGFSRQEYWSGLLYLSPGDLPDSRIEPMIPMSPALLVGSLPTEPPGKPRGLHKLQFTVFLQNFSSPLL